LAIQQLIAQNSNQANKIGRDREGSLIGERSSLVQQHKAWNSNLANKIVRRFIDCLREYEESGWPYSSSYTEQQCS
jgi:hypothetical protein